MSKTDGYNGWTSYETYLVNVWLHADEASYNWFKALRAERVSDHEKAERLESLVRESYEFEPIGLVADFVNAAFERVNWMEVVRNRS